MLKSVSLAVRSSIVGLFLAAIFSTTALSADSSLFSLTTGMNDLVYGLSRSIVSVEAGSEVSGGGGTFPGRDSWCTVISSGLIVDSSGLIMAAAESVIGQEQITVIFDNVRYPAMVVGVDYQHSLALLKIDRPIGRPVTFSDRQACAGQVVVAMGNAYGLRVSPSIGFCAGTRDDGRLQFSLPLTSGAIGGGVFDLSGRLLGVMVGSLGRMEQAVLAVPSYRAAPAIEYLKVFGDRHAGFVGLTVAEISINPPLFTSTQVSLATALPKVPIRLDAGLLVTSMFPNGPADRAGVRVGDVIFAIGSKRVGNNAELSAIARQLEPDMTINLELIRRGDRLSVPLVVGKRAIPARMGIAGGRSGDDRATVIDSLSRALEQFKREVVRLEKRLNSLQ